MPVVYVLQTDYSLTHPYAIRFLGEKNIHMMFATRVEARDYIGSSELRLDGEIRDEDYHFFFQR